jgi:hypothetical protein
MNKKTKVTDLGFNMEWRVGTAWNEKTFGWYLECRTCDESVRVGSDDVKAVTCFKCVNKQVNQPIEDDKD